MPVNLHDISFLIGKNVDLEEMPRLRQLCPFHPTVISFLGDLAEALRKNREAKQYPDVVTFSFFCRKANIKALEAPYLDMTEGSMGRGVSFHIAPSNVPINFAFSLVAGLLSGNACIVRISEKEFPQVDLVCSAMRGVLEHARHAELRRYLVVARYGHSLELNAYFSSLCDVRIIWGGDNTIAQIRKAPLPARAFDLTLADRYSVCVIDAERYLAIEDKRDLARRFYNDTYLFDQNACSSPRLIVWIGGDDDVTCAKQVFWKQAYQILDEKGYRSEPLVVVEKLAMLCRAAIGLDGAKREEGEDNRIIRITLDTLDAQLPQYACAGGLFYEYGTTELGDLLNIVSRKYQTMTYIGFDAHELRKTVRQSATLGIDRIVPVGDAASFSLIWDGYDLIRQMSRTVGAR